MQEHKYALAKGTQLQGKYTIKSVLGQGGFGITYLATHDSLGKSVAIKELFLSTQSIFCSRNETDTKTVKPHFDTFEIWKSKFLDEAKTLVRFSGKKGIVQISDMFEENNTSYFVMDYIEGTALSDLVRKKGKLTEQQASIYMMQVLEALAQVHAEGILHRDLKPDNLIIRNTDNQIILIDFGIAREYVENETVTHTAMMSVGYAPPEQKDTRAKRTSSVDLYSVGAVLYFCLTGQRPQTTDEIATDDYISAKALNPAISLAMNSLIDKAIAKKPANRFQSCEEMIAALQNLHSTAKTINNATDATDIHETIIEATVETQKNPFVEKYKEKQVAPTPNRTPMYIGVGVVILLVVLLLFWQPWAKKAETDEQASTTTETPVNVDTAAILATQAQKEAAEQAAQQAQTPTKENEQADNTAWQQAQQGNSKASYQTYLSNYAKGLHATEAKKAMKAFDLPAFDYQMVYVAGGSFQMGYDPNRDGEDKYMDTSKPLHTVQVGNFFMGKYEVTQAQWREIMGNNPSKFKNCDTCPVEQVTWNDIQEFLKKLNAKYPPSSWGSYRLPTEEEWEYAARGGKQSKGYKYAGSNSIGSVAWHEGNSSSKTHSVGQKSPNELGIYDMTGNIWEWTNSGWSDNYEKNSSFDKYVLRGGSWYNYGTYISRVAYRDIGYPNFMDNSYYGFRLCISQ